jgi:hypothetical protein
VMVDLIGRLFRSIAGWRWPRLPSSSSTPWVCFFSLNSAPPNFSQFRIYSIVCALIDGFRLQTWRRVLLNLV